MNNNCDGCIQPDIFCKDCTRLKSCYDTKERIMDYYFTDKWIKVNKESFYNE